MALTASCRIPGHHGAAGGGASLTALANGLELGFVVPRQALSGMGGDFSEPATRRFSISWLLPGRSDRCQDWDPHFDHGGAITKLVRRPSPPMGQSMRSVLQGAEQSVPRRGGENIDRATFGRKICAATCYAAIFNFACSSDQYSMSKRSASLIGVKQP